MRVFFDRLLYLFDAFKIHSIFQNNQEEQNKLKENWIF